MGHYSLLQTQMPISISPRGTVRQRSSWLQGRKSKKPSNGSHLAKGQAEHRGGGGTLIPFPAQPACSLLGALASPSLPWAISPHAEDRVRRLRGKPQGWLSMASRGGILGGHLVAEKEEVIPFALMVVSLAIVRVFGLGEDSTFSRHATPAADGSCAWGSL